MTLGFRHMGHQNAYVIRMEIKYIWLDGNISRCYYK